MTYAGVSAQFERGAAEHAKRKDERAQFRRWLRRGQLWMVAGRDAEGGLALALQAEDCEARADSDEGSCLIHYVTVTVAGKRIDPSRSA